MSKAKVSIIDLANAYQEANSEIDYEFEICNADGLDPIVDDGMCLATDTTSSPIIL